MKKHYIKAIVQLLLSGRDVDAVLLNLSRVLKEKGHESLHAQILQGVASELAFKRKMTASAVVVASSKDAAIYKESIEAALAKLNGKLEEALFTTDETLIGGYIASHNGIQINNSHKEKLVTLYRSITK
jgi:F0F1-type ATP synthase delta subunit